MATGNWIKHKQYGKQFQAEKLELIAPDSLAGIEKYLASGIIKGIGPATAKKLIDQFGSKIFAIIEQTPQQLSKIPGFGPKKINSIARSWQDNKVVKDIIIFLQEYGIGTTRAIKIFKCYGNNAIEKIKNNPYQLINDIRGIGFKIADDLALAIGVQLDSIIRLRAGIEFILQEMTGSGSCAIKLAELSIEASKILEIEQESIEQAIEELISDEEIIIEIIDNDEHVFLKKLYQAECSVVNNIIRLQHSPANWLKDLDPVSSIAWCETNANMLLAPQQKKAISRALSSKICIITGGPGVGKTTILNLVIRALKKFTGIKISLCSPTGRAAKRLQEATNFPATTIHRLLEYSGSDHGFKKNSGDKLKCKFLVVDECSMIDLLLFNSLLEAIDDDCGLLLVGDADQLPAVGPGNVLSDLIQSNTLATVKLDQIFRQGKNSEIIQNAHMINKGYIPKFENKTDELTDFYFIECKDPDEATAKLKKILLERIPQRFKLDPKYHVQVLTPMRKGQFGVANLNVLLQTELNNQKEKITKYGNNFSVGDKVMQLCNNYDKEVYNGDIGYVIQLDLENQIVTVDFDQQAISYDFSELDELTLAYAVTIHKSQGSEYPALILPLFMQHYPMLERNLIYTGITRGKQLVIVLGEKKAIAMAVKTVKAKTRITNLKDRLNQELSVC